MSGDWQRRWHPILEEWVLIAANTQGRPWEDSGRDEIISAGADWDESCYLCPRVKRASGNINPDYQTTFVFDNDFPVLASEAPEVLNDNPFEKKENLKGVCRVLCYHPKHNVHLADLEPEFTREVISSFQEQYIDLISMEDVENVLMFENKGRESGSSNSHPHAQIYATSFVPKNIKTHQKAFNRYRSEHGECLMCNLLENEMNGGERLVFENDSFVVFVPFFARFAYELMLVSKVHRKSIAELEENEMQDLAEAYHVTLKTYDRLFSMPFPNIISFINTPKEKHGAPEDFHAYISFCPPLRSPGQRKYLAGFESAGGNIVNPVQPEVAASRLREAFRKI